MDDTFLNDYYLLWILLLEAETAISKARTKQVGKCPFPNQPGALIVIWLYNGQATPTLVARYLFTKHHSASELISNMAANGLVIKRRDEVTRNVVRITITQKGKDFCAHYMGLDFISEMMSSLSDIQRSQLQIILKTLLDKASRKLGTQPVVLPEVNGSWTIKGTV
jgi:DNA-binding MarR family transcriptional regulator